MLDIKDAIIITASKKRKNFNFSLIIDIKYIISTCQTILLNIELKDLFIKS